jgi:drug/metabolite transporter (DMT)-like permease
VITGLPPFGADIGGLLTGIAAAAVILVSDRPTKVPWRYVMLGLVAAVAATLAVAYLDSLRPVAEQTHFGRFGDALFGGDASALRTVLRKASQSWSSLSFSRFTYVIPLGIAALAVLLRRPQGPLREVLPAFPLFRSALAGLLVAGVLGFLLNDSGVAVPAMLLAQGVPLVVLLGVDHVRAGSALDSDG